MQGSLDFLLGMGYFLEGSVSLAPRRFPGCRIVFLGAREGFLATRNMGARKHFIGEK